MAQAWGQLGCDRAAVVRAEDGMDEVSLSCPTHVVEWNGESIVEYTIQPEMVGAQRCQPNDVAGGDAAQSAAHVKNVLRAEHGPRRDVVAINAALALFVSGTASDLRDGWAMAQRSIDSGAAMAKLAALIQASNA
jgi:anthranilate phosphoribosyltransferase